LNHIKVSVVVPVFEQWDVIDRLMESLVNQTLPLEKWELLIVNNGSRDIPDYFELPRFATLIHCLKPGSYSARNKGVEMASGDLIAFTDADCIPDKHWLEEILFQSESSGDNTLIAGAVKMKGGENGFCSDAEVYDVVMGIPQTEYVRKGYAVTANLLVPRAVFERVGLFDSSRFSGGDADLCRRALARGFVLNYSSSAVVYHPARSDINDLVLKRKRIKGGQVTCGSYYRRCRYVIFTFLPPVKGFLKALLLNDYNVHLKKVVLKVMIYLWFVEMQEVIRLLLGKEPERR